MLISPDPSPELVRELFTEYGREIGVPIDESSDKYDLVLVAFDEHTAAGCAAMRAIEPGIAELKRLYVRRTHRGTGLGRLLAKAIIDQARSRGFTALRLDTLPAMQPAIAMYSSLGFQPISAYHNHPLPGMLYFELSLF